MATIDHQAWLDALQRAQASTNAYGFDPSWFAQDQLTETSGQALERMKREYLAQNPGARDWSTAIKEAERNLKPDTFASDMGSLVMTPEGAQAYSDLLTKRNRSDDMGNLATVAALAAAAFGGAGLMGSGTGTLGAGATGVESLGGIAPELTAPLSTVGSDLAASQIALGGIPGLEAAGGIGALGGLGYEAPSLLGSVAPELTAPLSTAGSDAAFTQLMADPILSASAGLPTVGNATFKALPELGGLGSAMSPSSGIADSLKSIPGKLSDFATSPGGIASLVGAAAGAASGGGDKTSTVQSQIDPVMRQYLYGSGYGDKNSVLGAAQGLYQSNPTGINPTMQQGLDMQRQSLLDPAYSQGYQQMRSLGQSLLSGFGQSPTVQPGGGPVTDRTKALMARGKTLIG